MNFSQFTKWRFHTKVLVPVIAVIVLLMGTTMYVVNHRLTRQMWDEADKSLATADAVFRSSQKTRQRSLQFQLRGIPNAPHFRATFMERDPATISALLENSSVEIPGDLVVYKSIEGKTLGLSRRDRTLDTVEFERNSAKSAEQALEGLPNVDTIRVSDRLFDVVSFPVTLPVTGEVIGALTICLKFGEPQARELSENTGCSIVLIANNSVVAASLRRRDLLQQCVSLFDDAAQVTARHAAGPNGRTQEIIVPEEQFLPRLGKFDSLNDDTRMGYVLLYSYAPALLALQATQRMIVAVSLGGIALATAVVWFFVRSTTRPLRLLRDSVEAVGRGDFSQHVQTASQDECGELATVFNQMTENLKTSRAKLEDTVVRLESTQAQLIQSEKLSAIGEFVAGVTHELNNPLTSLLGFSELLQQTNVDERQKRFVDRIANSARRCHKIVQSLLSFARQHAPERKPTNLNELVEAVIEIMAYEMRTSNIEVIKQLDLSLTNVLADPHQLQQVFLNLVNNARQAMEEHRSSGTLIVRTEMRSGSARVTFQDTGPGISDENLKKIFDPFFTTKQAGKGTGLGLSLSYGIVHEHGGNIRVESKLGAGTTFIIDLPAPSVNESMPEAATATSPELVAFGGGQRVLLIDDEEAILDFLSEVLRADGFQVDTAGDGEAALARLREAHYDLALCDWKMPGLNGQRLFERLQREDPATARRFVFMTGDVINHQVEAFLKEHRKTCLPKPFTISDFRHAISGLAQAA